jgi:WD40 repeat protein
MKFRLFLFAMLLLTIPLVARAQELPETHTSSDGKLTIRYPLDWVVEEDDNQFFIATSQTTLDTYRRSPGDAAPMPPNEALMVIAVLPEGENIGDDKITGSAADVMALVMKSASVSSNADKLTFAGKPETFTLGGQPAAVIDGTFDRNQNQARVFVRELPNHLYEFAVGVTASGGLPKFGPKIRDMAASLVVNVNPPASTGVSLGGLQTLTMLNAAKLSRLATLHGHEGAVRAVAISPDGKLVASCGDDGMVRLRDVATGTTKAEMKGHDGIVRQVIFSPDGKTLASLGDDGTLRLWDVAEHNERAKVGATGEFLWYAAYSPDSRHIAYLSYTADSSGNIDVSTVWLYDTLEKATKTIDRLDKGLSANSIAFSPDGKSIFYTASDYDPKSPRIHAWIYDVAAGTVLVTKDRAGGGIDVAYTPEGVPLATMNIPERSSDVILWDVAADKLGVTLKGHQGDTYHTIIYGDFLGSASYDGTAKLWNRGDGALLASLPHSGDVYGLDIGQKLVATGDLNGHIFLWGVTGSSA